jgi:hypothetical protein
MLSPRSLPCQPVEILVSQPASKEAVVLISQTSNVSASEYKLNFSSITRLLIYLSNAPFNIDFINCAAEGCDTDEM